MVRFIAVCGNRSRKVEIELGWMKFFASRTLEFSEWMNNLEDFCTQTKKRETLQREHKKPAADLLI